MRDSRQPARRTSKFTARMRVLTTIAFMLIGLAVAEQPASAMPVSTGASLTAISAQGGCWNGARKSIYTEGNGNQHHIVEFDVNISVPDGRWYIAARPSGFPFGASVWPGYYNRTHKWIGYNWPYNWWDPYSPSSWRLCY